ncbi:MAG: FAD-dependent oxidoreductase [Candidatus Euphemobacter frigidus]|nr:FAD-dependent oxidoreductase [Candidatus Euphemobacter frigidus]
MNSELPIIIIGAGPAGLAAARTIEKSGRKVIVLEKRSLVGGISSSRFWEEFIIEFGPHTYHVKEDEIDGLIRDHYDGVLAVKKRVTNMLIRGGYYDYPLKFWQLVRGLNPFFSAQMIGDFIYTSIKYTLFPRPDDSFETWGIKRFGRTLYNLCFGQYSRRVWGIAPARLSIRLASSKLHKLNLKDILVKLLGGKGQEQATYWNDFLYPEEGMGVIFANMAKRIREGGGQIWLNTVPTGITFRDNRVVSVIVDQDGEEHSVPCADVISTIPLTEVSKLCRPGLSEEEFTAGRSLRNRSLILVNLIINSPIISRAHWIYLLDPHFRFNRFCEQKNLLLDPKPAKKTLITFELCCEYDDLLWNATDEELRALALEDIASIDIIDGSRAGKCLITRVKDAYPIYDLAFEHNLETFLGGLSRIKNFYSTGRQGLFLNTDMHDTIHMGVQAARVVISGRPPQSWYREVSEFQ